MKWETKALEAKAYELREQVIRIINRAKAGHVGGDMSIMDILVELYYEEMNISPENQNDPARDRFVLSKGHVAESLYAVLADRGFIPVEELETFQQFGTRLIGHPNNKVEGVEMNSGALGHGLSVCVGMALAGRMQALPYRVYTVMGDGELAEGSIWEAVECAAQYKLDNLCAVIDKNGLQISGTTEQVMSHENLVARFEAYRWNVVEVNGHDFAALRDAFAAARAARGCPTAVIADTVKGRGISFMENNVKWHHKVCNEEEFRQAIAELEARREECAR